MNIITDSTKAVINTIEPLAGVAVKTADLYKQYAIEAFLAAILLLISLAWNDVVQEIIKMYYPISGTALKGKIIYAISITVIVVTLQIFLFPHLTNNSSLIKTI